MSHAALFTTRSSALSIIRQLLLAFLLGFVIASAVALFVFPTTSRSNIFHRVRAYPHAVNPILKAEIEYVKCSEREGPWRLTRLASRQQSRLSEARPDGGKKEVGAEFGFDDHALSLKAAVDKLTSVHSGAHGQLYYAKQEIVLGKLTGEDLQELFLLLRAVYLPLAGIGMLPVMFRRLTKVTRRSRQGSPHSVRRESSASSYQTEDSPYGTQETETSHFVQPLCERLGAAAALVNQGLQHAFLQLELAKPKEFREPARGGKPSAIRHNDEESMGDQAVPGRPDFACYFEERRTDYFERRKHLPQTWASLNAFAPPSDHSTNSEDLKSENRVIRKEFFA
jgi:hypothetical protein